MACVDHSPADGYRILILLNGLFTLFAGIRESEVEIVEIERRGSRVPLSVTRSVPPVGTTQIVSPRPFTTFAGAPMAMPPGHAPMFTTPLGPSVSTTYSSTYYT